ncbi:MAG: single-stranded DNA-binding protein [Burkholderiales bacterium]
MNRIQLIGRLGRDPEGGQSGKGRYANFSLATHEFRVDRESVAMVDHTEWHALVCYDRLADVVLEFLTRGSEVYVEGRLRGKRWLDREGKEQRSVEIRVDELRMLRRAPSADPAVAAAKGMASIESVLNDVAVGLRTDVSLTDLANMLHVLRANLVGEGDGGRDGRDADVPRGIA